jgi:SAM-dependent methyltransferase
MTKLNLTTTTPPPPPTNTTEYRDLDPTLFSSQSTWLNLGLWTSESENAPSSETGYTIACETLARRVGELGKITNDDRILDAGCGRGDSLVLWRKEFKPKYIIGVNLSLKEAEASKRLWACISDHDEYGIVIKDDAVKLINEMASTDQIDAVVSVDAAYHFNTRRAFLRACGQGNTCKRIAASDIILSEHWERAMNNNNNNDNNTNYTRIKNRFIHLCRRGFLWSIRFLAGVPMDNLMYGPIGLAQILRQEAGFQKKIEVQIITDQVFAPFARFCRKRARELGFVDRFWLRLTGWIMGMLGKSGALDVVLYVAERD